MSKRAMFVVVLALLLPTLLAAGCGKTEAGGKQGQPPDFVLPSLDGSEVRLSDLKGKVVLLNFWTTWCPDCVDEMPLLQEAYAEKQADGLVVLAVDLKEDKAKVQRFVDENGLTFTVLLDRKGEVSDRYNVYYIPHTVIIDRDGEIRRVKTGAFASKDEILRAVNPLLGQ